MDLGKIFKNNLYLILILAASLAISWPLFLPGYFSHHDDLQVMRVFEMRKCFEDLQIPCRWVPDMGYGNGYPLFNYYNPLPYYIGGFLSFIFGYVFAVKILFLIAAFLGGISMYFLAKEIFGKEAGFVAAILYQFAPYRALDLYVRGALAESFAIAIAPFCFYFALKLIKKFDVRYMVGLSFSLASLLTSHNIMAIFFTPLLLIWIVLWVVWEKSKANLVLILSLGLGMGLASFFILPSYFEKDLVQIDNLTRLDLDFRAHFATINQLFLDRSWGYGASFLGPNDTISLQIGWPHWQIAFLSAGLALYSFKKKLSKLALLIFIIFATAVFMTHVRSAFIWEQIGILRFAQFPWRFLSVVVFAASLLGGYLISISFAKYRIYLISALLASVILLNWSYFKPQHFYPEVGDREKLSGSEWEKQQKAAILDYLPQGAVQPREAAPNGPILVSGKAEIGEFDNRSNKWKFNINVADDSRIEVPVFDFPNWRVWANNQLIAHDNKNFVGRITINLSKGDYLVEGRLENTPIRTFGNIITLISISLLAIFTLYGKSRKIFR